MRLFIGLPPRMHSRYIASIFNDIPLEVQFHKRFVKFVNSIISSDNPLIKVCAKLVLNGSSSNVCNNLNHIWYKYNILLNKENLVDPSNRNQLNSVISEILNNHLECLDNQDEKNVNGIKDVLYLRLHEYKIFI